MPNAKVSALSSLTGSGVDSAADVLPIVDTSGGETKKITWGELLKSIPLAVFDKAAGGGIKLDPASPTYGRRDITGNVQMRSGGASSPTFAVYRGGIYQYSFGTVTGVRETFHEFHMPHDYAPGTDVFIHAHWSQIVVDTGGGGGVPGVIEWNFEITWAKGFDQAAFAAPITATVTQQGSTTQYQHMIAEVQLSSGTPTANQLDTALLEVDGLFLVRCWRNAGAANDTLNQAPFLHCVDLHYQSQEIGTKAKAPNFYV